MKINYADILNRTLHNVSFEDVPFEKVVIKGPSWHHAVMNLCFVVYNSIKRTARHVAYFFESQSVGDIEDHFGPFCLKAHNDIPNMMDLHTTHLPHKIMYGVLK